MGKGQYEWGIAAIFADEHQLLKAAQEMRDSGHRFEAISPFPVHGMEEACGIKRSWIPYVAFGGGFTGLSFGTWFTYWTSSVNWPVNVGGKPFFSLPAFVPVMFELTVLFAALSSVAALLFACGLPKVDPPVIDPDLTSHKFAIFVPEQQTGYNEENLKNIFQTLGAQEIKKTQF